MATVIDSLLVRLGLDSSEFKKGTKEVDSGLKQITKSATAFLAVLGGSAAMKNFIEQQVEANSALDRFSKNLGEAVSTVSAWSQAAEVAGGSAAGLQGTMDMLSKAQTELYLTGQSHLIPYFARFGIAMNSLPSEKLLALSDNFSKMDRTMAVNMGQRMGIDAGTMQLLIKGRGEVELMLKRQKEYNAVTKQQAEEASRLKVAMTESKQSFEAFGRELLSRATPAIEALFRILEKIGNWARQNKEFVQAFLTIIAVGIGAIGVAMIPLNGAAALILGISAAIAALWQDYQTFKRGGETLIDWKKWEPGIKSAISGTKELARTLMDAGYRMAAFMTMTAEFYSGNTKGARRSMQMMLDGMPSGNGNSGSESPASGISPSSVSGGSDRDRFIAAAASQLGVSASVIDAHLRTETGKFGLSAIGQYNYGNIKSGSSWKGKTSGQNVLEYDKAGNPLNEKASFRAYSSPEEAAADYARLIGSRYPGASGAANAESYAEALKRGGYATDPNYVSKIAKIAKGIPGASASASGAGARASVPMAGNSSSVETNISEVKIYTAATDAHGIAQDFGREMDYLTTSQANSGTF